MGSSADEIDRQISSTRDQIDANLDALERRAASGARRVGVIAGAGLIAGLAITGAAYLVYRTVREPSLADGPEEARRTWKSIGRYLAQAMRRRSRTEAAETTAE